MIEFVRGADMSAAVLGRDMMVPAISIMTTTELDAVAVSCADPASTAAETNIASDVAPSEMTSASTPEALRRPFEIEESDAARLSIACATSWPDDVSLSAAESVSAAPPEKMLPLLWLSVADEESVTMLGSVATDDRLSDAVALSEFVATSVPALAG